MKKIFRDKIINVDENTFDNKFIFEIWSFDKTSGDNTDLDIIFLEDLLIKRKNEELYNNLWDKFAMYSNVYSPKDELEIFTEIFENAIKNNKKTHIVWVTLKAELDILEQYYNSLWFMREDVNCFELDFDKTLVTCSVKIENLMWKWSDYKANKRDIFFIPPVRESWENKAMFKWINKNVISWIYLWEQNKNKLSFLEKLVLEEKILPLRMWEVLSFNFENIWIKINKKEEIFEY